MSNSEHAWKGSKDTKQWLHVHVTGVSARTCFTLKLATLERLEERASINACRPRKGHAFEFSRTVFSQEGQIAAEMLRFLILLFLDVLRAGPGFDAISPADINSSHVIRILFSTRVSWPFQRQ